MIKGDFRKLIRNLRLQKKHEKFIHIGNSIAVTKGEKGKKSDLRLPPNIDSGEEPHG